MRNGVGFKVSGSDGDNRRPLDDAPKPFEMFVDLFWLCLGVRENGNVNQWQFAPVVHHKQYAALRSSPKV